MEPKIDFEEIKKAAPKIILLQGPEGLKTRLPELAEKLEKETLAKVLISGEACYGACDLPLEAAGLTKSDLIVHLGHADFGVKSDTPVIYISIEYGLKLPATLKNEIAALPEKTFGIFSSVQFRKALEELEALLKENGKEILTKQIILGCNEVRSAAEANIFVGSGKFHPKALKGKVYHADIEKGRLADLTEEIERVERKRFARLELLKDAKSVGILVSTKPGQFFPDYEKLKARLEAEGKKATVIIFNEITNDKLLGLKFDAYVNTACPRILDNHFDKPVINLKDL
ncbi:MAG: diphthamide biosynthesis enzyme Dph2 [Candidatus Aenigmatarchaeota archaeon]